MLRSGISEAAIHSEPLFCLPRQDFGAQQPWASLPHVFTSTFRVSPYDALWDSTERTSEKRASYLRASARELQKSTELERAFSENVTVEASLQQGKLPIQILMHSSRFKRFADALRLSYQWQSVCCESMHFGRLILSEPQKMRDFLMTRRTQREHPLFNEGVINVHLWFLRISSLPLPDPKMRVSEFAAAMG